MKTEQLKTLWELAFGDPPEFIELFFSTAWDLDHCHFLTEGDQVTAALYWLDCQYRGQPIAYVYAVATHPGHRNKGLCRILMAQTRKLLQIRGYSAALLRPADPGLRQMYAAMGYRTCTYVSEFSCTCGDAVDLREVGPEEYALLRRQYLPAEGVIQEGAQLTYLNSYCRFYRGEDFLLAGTPQEGSLRCQELLGNSSAAPGILGALDCKEGFFRCPGSDLPFAMGLALTREAILPGYFGLAFD